MKNNDILANIESNRIIYHQNIKNNLEFIRKGIDIISQLNKILNNPLIQ